MWKQKVVRLGIPLLLGVAIFTLFHASPIYAITPNQELSFEGKIVTSSTGINIPDSTYNMEFKIYSGCTNEPTNNTGCTLVWTEDHLVNTSTGITTSSGTYVVALGSVCSFAGGSCEGYTNTGVTWSATTLYLSMQVGSTLSTCTAPTSYLTATNCNGDGEMSPYIPLDSVPSAFSAQELSTNTGTYTSTLSFTTPTATQTITIPNNSGTVLVSGGDSIAGPISVGTDDSNTLNLIANGNTIESLSASDVVSFQNADTVDIGSNGTSTSQLYVSGSVATSAIGSVGSIGYNPNSIFVSGHYAYATAPGSKILGIYDVSNPASPIAVGSVSTGTGQPSSVYVAGRYAYVALTTINKLGIYDVSNPASPVSVGSVSTGTNPQSVYVQGRYAYVANNTSGTLGIYDISNPANPVSVGSVSAGSNPQSVYVSGSYAYVVNDISSGTLVIYDISNPASPVLVGSVSTGATSFPQSVYVSGRYAYVTNYNSGTLGIYDVSNPANPVSVGSGTGLTHPYSVYVQGRYAYVANYGGGNMAIFDVSNPASPASVGSVTLSADSEAIFVSGRYAYAAITGNSTIAVINLGGSYIQQLQAGGTETGTLQVDADAQIGGDANIQGSLTVGTSLQATGNATLGGLTINSLTIGAAPTLANVGAGSGTNYTYEVSAFNPSGQATTPTATIANSSTLSTTVYNTVTWSAVAGATGYNVYRTAGGSSQGAIVSAVYPSTTTTSPTVSAFSMVSTTATITFTAPMPEYVVGQTVNLAGFTPSGINQSNVVIASVTPSSNQITVTLSANYTETGLGTVTGNLSIGDIGLAAATGSTSPTANTNTSGTLSVAGSTVIGTTGTPTSQLFVSGSVPAGPIGSLSTGSGAQPRSVFVSGHYAYVADFNAEEIVIYDVSNPANPVAVGSVSTGSNNPYSIYVSGRYAYVADYGGSFLAIYDVSNPANPVAMGSITTGTLSNPDSVYVSGRYAYVTTYTSNTLLIIDVSNPASPAVLTNNFSLATGSNPRSVFASGHYAYVADFTTNTLAIYDVSNPTEPVSVGSITTGLSSPISVYVQGNYAYVVNAISSGTLAIYDVSNPTEPVFAGSVSTGSSSYPASVYVSGRYAYTANSGTNNLGVYDVSNPASPQPVGTVNAGSSSGPFSVFVSGRYAYTADLNNSTLDVFDLGGAYIQQLQAGSTETGTLQVDANAQIAGDANVQGSLTIGTSLQAAGNASLGGLTINSLAIGAAPTLVNVGGGSGTNYSYEVSAFNPSGQATTPSATIFNGATLSSTVYNTVTWSAVTGATGYNVYRTYTGSGLIATVYPSSTVTSPTVSAFSMVSTTATITFTAPMPEYAVGQTVNLAGFTPSGINQSSVVITSVTPSSNQIQVTLSSNYAETGLGTVTGNLSIFDTGQIQNSAAFQPYADTNTTGSLVINGNTTLNGSTTIAGSLNITGNIIGSSNFIGAITATDSVTLQDANANPLAFSVNNSETGSPIITAGTNNLVTNGDFEGSTAGWIAYGTGASIYLGSNSIALGVNNSYTGSGYLQVVVGTTAAAGTEVDSFNQSLPLGTYTLSFYAKTTTPFSTLAANFFESSNTACTLNSNSVTSSYSQFYCTITTTAVTTYIDITDGSGTTALTFYIDNVQLTPATNLLTNPGFESGSTGWTTYGTGSGILWNNNANLAYSGLGSLKVTTGTTGNAGAETTSFTSSMPIGTYTVSFDAGDAGTAFSTLSAGFGYSSGSTACASLTPLPATVNVPTTGFVRYSCTVTTTAATTYVYIDSTSATSSIFYIDSVQVSGGSSVLAYDIGVIQLRGIIDSPVTFQGLSNSTTAFQIENAAGSSELAVDTQDNQVNIGTPSTQTTKLTFGSSLSANTASIQAGNVTGSYTWTLPTADSAGCIQSNGSGTLSISTCGDTSTQTFPSNGNYTVPTNALMAIVEAWGSGGGGGGGTGGSTAAVRSGGGGGAGGAYNITQIAASALGTAGTTVPVTVGTAGTSGGAGANGGAGNPSCLSTTTGCAGTMDLEAFGGGGGAGTGTAGNGGGGGGGSLAVGGNGATATGGTGGNPLGSAAGLLNSGEGGGGGGTAAATGAAGGASANGGGGGGSSSSTGAGNSGAGGGSNQGGAGGGGGGSCAITTCTLRSGGAGGNVPGVSGGGGTAGTTAGQAGGTGAAGVGSGGSGGGGGADNAAGTGGTGGTGGARGGGGGGGGAGETTTGGAGGTGGVGFLRVTTLQGSGADLAEIYCTNDTTIVPGDVVSIDPTLNAGVIKSQSAYDPNTIGIISTNPGLVTGTVSDQCAMPVLVALSGRVPLQVSLENGPIEPGDYLTPSSTPGVAMKATKAGKIIGQALTAYTDPTLPDDIVAFVEDGTFNGETLSQLLPTPTDPSESVEDQALDYFMSDQNSAVQTTNLSEILTDRVSAALEVITPTVVANNIQTNAITPATSGNVSILLGANNNLIIKNQTNNDSFTIDDNGNAQFGLSLSVLGDMQTSGNLTVDGSSLFNGNATFAEMAQFLGDTSFAGNVNAEGRVTFNSDAGGLAIIKQGASQVDVSFKNPYAQNPIVSATLSADQVMPDGLNVNISQEEQELFDAGYTYLISNVTTTGFTIVLNKVAGQDLEFNWTAIAVNNANTTISTPNPDGTNTDTTEPFSTVQNSTSANQPAN